MSNLRKMYKSMQKMNLRGYFREPKFYKASSFNKEFDERYLPFYNDYNV